MGEVGAASLAKTLNSEPLTGVTQELHGAQAPGSSMDP